MRFVRCLAVLLILIIFCQPASADAIGVGERPVEFCARIKNLDAHPDKVFVIFRMEYDSKELSERYSLPEAGYSVVKENECIQFGPKSEDNKIYWIEKEKFSEDRLVPMVQWYFQRGQGWVYPKTYVNDTEGQRKYISENYRPLGLIQRWLNVRDYNPTKRIVYEYTIEEKDGNLTLKLVEYNEGVDWQAVVFYLLVFTVFTWLVESFFTASFFLRGDPDNVFKKVFLINVVSCPIAYVLMNLFPNAVLVEAVIILLEIPLYRRLFSLGLGKSALISLSANIVSFLMGLPLGGSIGTHIFDRLSDSNIPL